MGAPEMAYRVELYRVFPSGARWGWILLGPSGEQIAEALVLYQSPDRALAGASRFIDLAEREGPGAAQVAQRQAAAVAAADELTDRREVSG